MGRLEKTADRMSIGWRDSEPKETIKHSRYRRITSLCPILSQLGCISRALYVSHIGMWYLCSNQIDRRMFAFWRLNTRYGKSEASHMMNRISSIWGVAMSSALPPLMTHQCSWISSARRTACLPLLSPIFYFAIYIHPATECSEPSHGRDLVYHGRVGIWNIPARTASDEDRTRSILTFPCLKLDCVHIIKHLNSQWPSSWQYRNPCSILQFHSCIQDL